MLSCCRKWRSISSRTVREYSVSSSCIFAAADREACGGAACGGEEREAVIPRTFRHIPPHAHDAASLLPPRDAPSPNQSVICCWAGVLHVI